jgi:hypothetical protein
VDPIGIDERSEAMSPEKLDSCLWANHVFFFVVVQLPGQRYAVRVQAVEQTLAVLESAGSAKENACPPHMAGNSSSWYSRAGLSVVADQLAFLRCGVGHLKRNPGLQIVSEEMIYSSQDFLAIRA